MSQLKDNPLLIPIPYESVKTFIFTRIKWLIWEQPYKSGRLGLCFCWDYIFVWYILGWIQAAPLQMILLLGIYWHYINYKYKGNAHLFNLCFIINPIKIKLLDLWVAFLLPVSIYISGEIWIIAWSQCRKVQTSNQLLLERMEGCYFGSMNSVLIFHHQGFCVVKMGLVQILKLIISWLLNWAWDTLAYFETVCYCTLCSAGYQMTDVRVW